MRTVAQLARQYHRSDEWVRTKLAQYQLPTLAHQPRQVVVIMDVTYFGPWGVLVVIDPNAQTAKGQNLVLYHCFLEGSERTLHYEVALDTLEAMGYRVVGATIDGRRGVRELLEARHIPVQHCQFHQLQTVTKYLTRRPYLTQNQQLRSIALDLTTSTQDELTRRLDAWHVQHGTWLKQKDPATGRFMHPRSRQAYFSLRRNMPYLFTHRHATAISIPNTTNALDGRFGVWKVMLHRHRGCSKALKTKILRSLFAEQQR